MKRSRIDNITTHLLLFLVAISLSRAAGTNSDAESAIGIGRGGEETASLHKASNGVDDAF